jgi:metal transporter CNNM
VLGMGRLLSLGISTVAAAPLTIRGEHDDEDHHETPLWILAIASLALTLIGGVFAGLTIAFVTTANWLTRPRFANSFVA